MPGNQVPSLPEQNIDLMRSWVQDCILNHPNCQADGDSFLPKRVIDVGTSAKAEVHLHESEGQRANYAALSHSWGYNIILTTTKSTLHDNIDIIPWSGLSKTFQDAVTITRLMGLRYLWVDSLCIIQDDALDWQIESSKMAEIYEKSYVTISANTSSGTLLGPLATRKSDSVRLEATDPDDKSRTIIIRPHLDHEKFFARSLEGVGIGWEKDYPLSRRAWCFQERLLATRILHFTEGEVVFECKTHCSCECGSILYQKRGTLLKNLYSGVIAKRFTPTAIVENSWDGWQRIVGPYAQKDITNPLDILPALAGLASRAQSDDLGQYVAGLWAKKLPEGLFWSADIVSTKSPPIQTAPSFSWASLSGTSKVRELHWPYRSPEDNPEEIFKILEAHCPAGGLNPYGVVSDGFVQIHGKLLPIKVKFEEVGAPFNCVMRSRTCEGKAIAFMDRDLITDITTERDYICFLGITWSQISHSLGESTSKVSALILEPVGTDVYKRAGCLPYLDNDPPWERDSKAETFKIT